jgi:hypothetical protein
LNSCFSTRIVFSTEGEMVMRRSATPGQLPGFWNR